MINLAPASYLATLLVLEQRYRLQEFCALILVTDRRTSKMTERRGRTVPLSEVLELSTQSGSDDEGSLGEVCVTAEYVLNRM